MRRSFERLQGFARAEGLRHRLDRRERPCDGRRRRRRNQRAGVSSELAQRDVLDGPPLGSKANFNASRVLLEIFLPDSSAAGADFSPPLVIDV